MAPRRAGAGTSDRIVRPRIVSVARRRAHTARAGDSALGAAMMTTWAMALFGVLGGAARAAPAVTKWHVVQVRMSTLPLDSMCTVIPPHAFFCLHSSTSIAQPPVPR